MSSRSRRLSYGVPARNGLGFMLALWALAEILAFALVVRWVGFGGAMAIGILTVAAGAIMLQRLGHNAVSQVRTAAGGGGLLHGARLTDGLLQALAAILLILPGFLSDAVGAILSIGPLRRLVRNAIGGTARPGVPDRPRDPGVVDLQPEDWRRVDRRE